MNKAIKLAIKGGWIHVPAEVKWVVLNKGTENAYRIANDTFLLDPSFWRCLGKAVGWKDNQGYSFRIEFGPHRSIWYQRGEEWNWHMYRFIDHLISGKDAESFFTNLFE